MDLHNHPEQREYLHAVNTEFDVMRNRGVLQIKRPPNIRPDQLGTLLLVLTKKRSGKYQARLVSNGRRQT